MTGREVPWQDATRWKSTRRERRFLQNLAKRTDEQLLANYYDRNDHFAFDELDQRYRASLAQSALHKLGRLAGRRQVADDLASEALVKALESRGRRSGWDRQRAVKPWLFTILHNCLSSFLRLRHNQTLTLSDLRRPSGDSEEPSLVGILPAEAPSPEARLLTAALDEELARSLPGVARRFSRSSKMVVLDVFGGRLGDQGRAILECIEELSPAERTVAIDGLGHRLDQQTIARMHGVSTAQVSKVLKLARTELAKKLAERGFKVDAEDL